MASAVFAGCKTDVGRSHWQVKLVDCRQVVDARAIKLFEIGPAVVGEMRPRRVHLAHETAVPATGITEDVLTGEFHCGDQAVEHRADRLLIAAVSVNREVVANRDILEVVGERATPTVVVGGRFLNVRLRQPSTFDTVETDLGNRCRCFATAGHRRERDIAPAPPVDIAISQDLARIWILVTTGDAHLQDVVGTLGAIPACFLRALHHDVHRAFRVVWIVNVEDVDRRVIIR